MVLNKIERLSLLLAKATSGQDLRPIAFITVLPVHLPCYGRPRLERVLHVTGKHPYMRQVNWKGVTK